MMEKRIGYRNLLTQKEYLKLIAANVINRFGDSIDSIAFTWMVYAVTGSAAWSAAIFGLNQLPTILVQPFTGVLAERWRKKHLMAITDYIRGTIVAALAVLYGMNLVTPWVLAVFTLCISTAEAFRVPAGMAFVPKILKREYYEFGTGLNASLSTAAQLLGMGAAGIILGIWGIKAAILIDAVTYFLSGMIIFFIHHHEELTEKTAGGRKAYASLLKDGLTYIKTKRIILNFCALAFVINALNVPLNSLLTPMVVEVLGKDSSFLSLINIVLFIGMGGSAFFYPYVNKKTGGTKLVFISGVAVGVSYLLYPAAGAVKDTFAAMTGICIAASLLLGTGLGLISAVLGAEFMKGVEADYMARSASIFNAAATAGMPLVSGLISLIAVFCPVHLILIACGILSMVLFISIRLAGMRFEALKDANMTE